MQKIYINYANDDFKVQQNVNSKQAKEIGNADRVISYNPNDIDDEFYNANKNILNKVRGGGYWLWKFYIIHKTLTDKSVKDGDVVFYCDSGADILKDLTPVFNMPNKYNQDIVLFCSDEKCKNVTKKDTFILMGCDVKEAHDFPIVAGGFNIWKKSTKSIKFIEECLKYACQSKIIDDSKSTIGKELPEFIMHRHDQCVFSLIAYKMGIKAISITESKIYCDNQDIKPDTFIKNNRKNNRSRIRKYIYSIAMLPEKFQKYGGALKYILRQFYKK
ncbi:MAG: hypothetical protein ACPG8V_03305 [Alphaproteobacteria bacterium]